MRSRGQPVGCTMHTGTVPDAAACSVGRAAVVLAAPTADTWIPVYAGADWHEREAFEMYGISFVGHPNLRKLYLPGDFEGHPLRKDFPLLARRVKPWPGIVDVEPMPGEDDSTEEPADA